MDSMGPTGAQKFASGPMFQDRHSGNIINNVVEVGAPFRRLTAIAIPSPVCSVCSRLSRNFLLEIVSLVLGVFFFFFFFFVRH